MIEKTIHSYNLHVKHVVVVSLTLWTIYLPSIDSYHMSSTLLYKLNSVCTDPTDTNSCTLITPGD